MSYQDPIYSQNGTGEINETVSVVNTSSDICVFNMPSFSISGASKIDCTIFSAATTGNTNVYCLTSETAIDLDFTFSANTTSLTGNTTFKYEIYKYNHNLNFFNQPPVYSSSAYTWDSYSATSAFTTSIPVSALTVDGDYLLKGYYSHDICTEFAGLLGETYSTSSNIIGSEYGIYQPDRDFHFVAFTKADEPILNNSFNSGDTTVIGSLLVNSVILVGGETEIPLPNNSGDYLIALNGSTLSPDFDYNIIGINGTSSLVAKLSGATISGDVFTFAYTNSPNNNNLHHDGYEITSPIVSGATDGEGSETVYYNTTESKYEFFTTLTPSNVNIVVTLNGVTLANNIDYTQSTSNPKRIVLFGGLLVGDIINVYYNTDIGPQGNVSTTSVNIGWTIATPPQTTNGLFTVEMSTGNTFTTLINSGTTSYVVGEVGYRVTLALIGGVGDVLYYRVKNDKGYTHICDTTISSVKYSDIIDITIQTNAINSY